MSTESLPIAAPTPTFDASMIDVNTVFQYRGYDIDCTPRDLPDGTFGAQAVLTKIGFHPEKAFRGLPEFPSTRQAVAHAKRFAEEWLDMKA
jgi:hypothetical protein